MEPRIPYSFADPLKRKRASALAGRWGRAKYEQRWRGASQGPALPLATAKNGSSWCRRCTTGERSFKRGRAIACAWQFAS